MKTKKIVVAVSGASGSIYGIRLIHALINLEYHVLAVFSSAGRKVMAHELSIETKEDLPEFLTSQGIRENGLANLDLYTSGQIDSAMASGSFDHDGMVVAPCSMKTLSAISSGFAHNLITRSADVCLKEKRPLILVPRETPFNRIHLENMTRAHDAGAVILPPNPSFYSFPQTIEALVDTVVARILDHLKIEHNLVERWT